MRGVALLPTFAIKPGQLGEFKAAARRLAERAGGETATLRYDQFLSDDGTRMLNIEVFANAAAFVRHSRNASDLVPALMDAGTVVHVDVIGEVDNAFQGVPPADLCSSTHLADRFFDAIRRSARRPSHKTPRAGRRR